MTTFPMLSNPVYTQGVRLRGWSGRMTATYPCTHRAAKVLARLAPEWTKEDHRALAEHHAKRARKLRAAWSITADRAAMDRFGRPFQVYDYRICAIGLDEFAEHHKRVLRHCAYAGGKHAHLAHVHARLAGLRKFVV